MQGIENNEYMNDLCTVKNIFCFNYLSIVNEDPVMYPKLTVLMDFVAGFNLTFYLLSD